MGIEIPKKIFGREVEGAMERALAKQDTQQEPEEKMVNAPNLDGYIFVPEIKLYVAKERTHQGKNWYDAHKALDAQEERMITIPQFIAFANYLEQNKGTISEAETILDEIFTVRDPWRSEWLDAKFEVSDTEAHILYNHAVQGDDIVAGKSEKLESYLASDKGPGISQAEWLSNPTEHGLPRENVSSGSLIYWHPRNGAVARFNANSGRTVLNCDGDPADRDASLGVRAVRRANSAGGVIENLGGGE
jgi:hypothetical protein